MRCTAWTEFADSALLQNRAWFQIAGSSAGSLECGHAVGPKLLWIATSFTNIGAALMKIEVLPDADSVAREGARIIAAEACLAVAARGRFVLAVSGGRTPWQMLRALGREEIPWRCVHVVQVDERVASRGHPDRNLAHLLESLLEHAPLPREQIHPMPVESPDLQTATKAYASTLQVLAGVGGLPVLDVAHLGLGSDGHTASLVPGDPVLQVSDADVAVTGVYQGRRRMTLTYPMLNRSRRILWLVAGPEKAGMLRRLCDGDASIPAGRICRDNALVLADQAAAGSLEPELTEAMSRGRQSEAQ